MLGGIHAFVSGNFNSTGIPLNISGVKAVFLKNPLTYGALI